MPARLRDSGAWLPRGKFAPLPNLFSRTTKPQDGVALRQVPAKCGPLRETALPPPENPTFEPAKRRDHRAKPPSLARAPRRETVRQWPPLHLLTLPKRGPARDVHRDFPAQGARLRGPPEQRRQNRIFAKAPRKDSRAPARARDSISRPCAIPELHSPYFQKEETRSRASCALRRWRERASPLV